jgi:DNA-binding beta-propeller fold protein YncE
MRVPSQNASAVPMRRLAVGALVVALALAACASSAASTPAPSAAAAPPTISSPPASPTPAAVPSSAPTPVATPASSLTALTLLWQKAGPMKAKTETYWPAIDPRTGDVWVASSFDNEYWIFSPDGKYLESWGVGGKGGGQLALTTHDMSPDGAGAIAFAPDGSFYIADVGNYRVEKFDKDRHFVTAWGSFGIGQGQFANPKGIATDGKSVYVADDGTAMQVFDADGHFIRAFDFPFVLFSLAPSGLLVSADTTGVLELDASGGQAAHFDLDWAALGGGPSQAVTDKAGDIYIGLQADSGPVGLVELDPNGKQIGLWSTGAETIALDPDGGAIYMADTGPSLSGWPYIRKYALPKR